MRAKFSQDFLSSPHGAEMTSILRACVHCGFCNATCPTYQLQGDELDGPRGRIYLIKSMLEEASVGEATQTHLDRCLTCRACETTCPSGVRYSRLLELARPLVEAKVARGPWQRIKRWLIRSIVPHPRRFNALMVLARAFKPLLPAALQELVPPAAAPAVQTVEIHSRKMILLDGCVQQSAAPNINAAARDIFNQQNIQLLSFPNSGCCGAVSYHLGELVEAQAYARCNIDAWTTALATGAQAVVATSTGCAMMLKEYRGLLAEDPLYAERASRISEIVCDPSEVLDPEVLGQTYRAKSGLRIAFHAPCTMQHGLGVAHKAEACLRAVGFELTYVPDSHLCCGSAGSYSLLQPELANRLLDQKVTALESGLPDKIVTANIGCLMHVQRRAGPEVLHWLEMIRPQRVGPE